MENEIMNIYEIDFASRFPPRRLGTNKKIKIGPRDAEIRVRSVRFTPRGVEKKVKGNFAIFRSVVTWAWSPVFEEPGCGGWFLVSHGVLAGF